MNVYDLLRPSDLVFDVGANVGNKTALYLERGARVVCFEPQPDLAEGLRRRFYRDHRVAVEQIGLAAAPGQLELSVCDVAPAISTFSGRWRAKGRFASTHTWNRVVSVPVDTLDAAIRRYGVPRFCKIDVEAFESSVLAGLSEPLPLLSFEAHSEMRAELIACLDLVEALGRAVFTVGLGEDPTFVFEWTGRGNLLARLDFMGSYFVDVYCRAVEA